MATSWRPRPVAKRERVRARIEYLRFGPRRHFVVDGASHSSDDHDTPVCEPGRGVSRTGAPERRDGRPRVGTWIPYLGCVDESAIVIEDAATEGEGAAVVERGEREPN